MYQINGYVPGQNCICILLPPCPWGSTYHLHFLGLWEKTRGTQPKEREGREEARTRVRVITLFPNVTLHRHWDMKPHHLYLGDNR